MVSKEDVLNIAKLAKLFVDESDIEELTSDTARIIEFADGISKSGKIKDKSEDPKGLSNEFRNDIPEESEERDLILKNADGKKDGFFWINKFRR